VKLTMNASNWRCNKQQQSPLPATLLRFGRRAGTPPGDWHSPINSGHYKGSGVGVFAGSATRGRDQAESTERDRSKFFIGATTRRCGLTRLAFPDLICCLCTSFIQDVPGKRRKHPDGRTTRQARESKSSRQYAPLRPRPTLSMHASLTRHKALCRSPSTNRRRRGTQDQIRSASGFLRSIRMI
jgi:hypothetical protein